MSVCHIVLLSSVFCPCSVTLDTPMNRKFMPDADHSKWTPLDTVAEYVCPIGVIITALGQEIQLLEHRPAF